MKNIVLFFLFTIIAATSVQAGSSQYNQYGQYGGGSPSTSITIDKMVGKVTTTKGGVTTFVDNNSISDPRYTPDKQVSFQIKVKNTSDSTLSNVEVTDILPPYVEAVEGPGNYDANTRIISWKYDQLKPGEEKTEKVIVQVYPQSKLPTDKSIFCEQNKSTVRVGNAYDEDTAQFCIEKAVTPAKQVPTAGPEYGLVLSALSLAGLSAGIYLKRKI